MTQEDRNLLLKDLCSRLPYNVVIRCTDNDTDYKCFLTTGILNELLYNTEYYDYKPYLRPMSSMTEEEIKTYHSYCECNDGDFTGEILYFDTIKSFDYLTSIHIDYRGLIPMGLALEAPEGMYKIK